MRSGVRRFGAVNTHGLFFGFFTVQWHAVHACKLSVRALEVCLSVRLPVLLFMCMTRI